MEPFIAQITLFAGNFAPRGWAFCNGQVLSIAQNTALFSLVGTTYGGNGQTTFALPDLRGRVPIHPGQGPGLSTYSLGQVAGSETVTLTTNQIPAHTHNLMGSTANGSAPSPAGNALAQSYDANTLNNVDTYAAGPATSALHPSSISATGSSQPHSNIQPYTCINYIIALEGVFPSRN